MHGLIMRAVIATVLALFAASTVGSAQADPYRWCAVYGFGGFGGGATNCGFVTLEQCEAAVSGVGGFCAPNQFYDGRPVRTPEDAPASRRRSSPRR
jgi:hypothetical protein